MSSKVFVFVFVWSIVRKVTCVYDSTAVLNTAFEFCLNTTPSETLIAVYSNKLCWVKLLPMPNLFNLKKLSLYWVVPLKLHSVSLASSRGCLRPVDLFAMVFQIHVNYLYVVEDKKIHEFIIIFTSGLVSFVHMIDVKCQKNCLFNIWFAFVLTTHQRLLWVNVRYYRISFELNGWSRNVEEVMTELKTFLFVDIIKVLLKSVLKIFRNVPRTDLADCAHCTPVHFALYT